MATTLQIVDPDSLSTVIFDLNDSTGANSALYGSVTTDLLSDVNIGSPRQEATRVRDRGTDHTRTTHMRLGLATMRFRMKMAGTYDNLATAIGVLSQHLARGCTLKWVPNGSAQTRYIDVEPSPTPVLLDGRELGMYEALSLGMLPSGVTISLERLPYLRGASLNPALNVLANPTMLRDANDDGDPTSWTVGAGTSTIASSVDAWSGVRSTVGSYILQDYTGAGAFTFSVEAWKVGNDTVQVRLLDQPGGTALATSTVTTTPTRHTVTGTVTGTDARVQIYQSAGTAGTTVYVRNAQLETGSSASPFRVGAATVAVEPDITGYSRILPVYNPGTAPSPCVITLAFPDASTACTDVLFGLKSTHGVAGFGRLADWMNVTHYAQLDATRGGWTVTAGTDTTANPGTAVSGGSTANAARVSHATAITDMTKRVTVSRTADLDSLRGEHDVWIRCRGADARKYRIQLRWSPANASPAVYAEEEYVHDTTDTSSGDTWVTLKLGTIRIPEEIAEVALGQVTFEVWTALKSGAASNLDLDFLAFAPGKAATASAPNGNRTVYLGSELTTPVTSPAGGTAGVVRDELLYFNTTTDNAGSAVFTGNGHYRCRVKLGNGGNADRTVVLAIRNTTGGSYVKQKTVTVPGNSNSITRWIHFDASGGANYQVQVDDPSTVNSTDNVRNIYVRSIMVAFVPAISQNEKLRTDPGSRPGRDNVEKLDSSGNLVGEYDSTDVPWLIPPGLSMLYFDTWDAPDLGYEEPESVISRTLTVTPTVYPRYRG